MSAPVIRPQVVLFLYEEEGKWGWSGEIPGKEILGLAPCLEVQYGQVEPYVCRFQSQVLMLRSARMHLEKLRFASSALVRVYAPDKRTYVHVRAGDLERLPSQGWRDTPSDVCTQLAPHGYLHPRAFIPPGSILTCCLG